MKVAELRAELSRRGADTKGTKPVLQTRLRSLMAKDKKDESPEPEVVDAAAVEPVEEPEETPANQEEAPEEDEKEVRKVTFHHGPCVYICEHVRISDSTRCSCYWSPPLYVASAAAPTAKEPLPRRRRRSCSVRSVAKTFTCARRAGIILLPLVQSYQSLITNNSRRKRSRRSQSRRSQSRRSQSRRSRSRRNQSRRSQCRRNHCRRKTPR